MTNDAADRCHCIASDQTSESRCSDTHCRRDNCRSAGAGCAVARLLRWQHLAAEAGCNVRSGCRCAMTSVAPAAARSALIAVFTLCVVLQYHYRPLHAGGRVQLVAGRCGRRSLCCPRALWLWSAICRWTPLDGVRRTHSHSAAFVFSRSPSTETRLRALAHGAPRSSCRSWQTAASPTHPVPRACRCAVGSICHRPPHDGSAPHALALSRVLIYPDHVVQECG